eukprot:UN10613
MQKRITNQKLIYTFLYGIESLLTFHEKQLIEKHGFTPQIIQQYKRKQQEYQQK